MTTLRFVFSLVAGVACIFSQYAVIESLKVVNTVNPDDVNLRVGYAVSGLTLGAFFIILYGYEFSHRLIDVVLTSRADTFY